VFCTKGECQNPPKKVTPPVNKGGNTRENFIHRPKSTKKKKVIGEGGTVWKANNTRKWGSCKKACGEKKHRERGKGQPRRGVRGGVY